MDKARKQGEMALNGAVAIGRRILQLLLNPFQKQTPPWTSANIQSVGFKPVKLDRKGLRVSALVSDSGSVPQYVSLKFEVEKDIPRPSRIFQHFVNTGRDAEAAGQLRGDFNEGKI